MPTRAEHAERRGRLKFEIPKRIASGQSLRAACAAAGVHIGLVCHWAVNDPVFRAELDQSQRRLAWLRREAFHDDQARAFLARLAAGESVGALLRDLSMPGRDLLKFWRMTQGEFAVEVQRLIDLHRAERVRRDLRRPPPDWNEALADRVLLMIGRGHVAKQLRKLDPALPAYRVIHRWRRE